MVIGIPEVIVAEERLNGAEIQILCPPTTYRILTFDW
jgi:hypothetical protein